MRFSGIDPGTGFDYDADALADRIERLQSDGEVCEEVTTELRAELRDTIDEALAGAYSDAYAEAWGRQVFSAVRRAWEKRALQDMDDEAMSHAEDAWEAGARP